VPYPRPKPLPGATKAPYPGFIEPALASSIEWVPSGERWVHEIKFDGYRVQLHIANESIRVFTRRGYDWTNRFQEDRERGFPDKRQLGVDGEVVVPAAHQLQMKEAAN
jgi:bifunctional non-homologous end joining protein LigD